MKKKIVLSFLILLCFVLILWLVKPIKSILISYEMNELNAKFISGIVVRFSGIYLSFVLIKRIGLLTFTGLTRIKRVRNLHATLIPITIIFMGLLSNWKTYWDVNEITLLLFALSVLSVGILEELVFRGLIFPLFIESFLHFKNPIVVGAITSSSLFGILHFINLYREPDNLIGIISQVFFALSIGVFFAGLLVRTENITIPAIIHALINFSFGSGELHQSISAATPTEEAIQSGINWNSVLPTTVFFTFILLGGIFMIFKSDKQKILNNLLSKSNHLS